MVKVAEKVLVFHHLSLLPNGLVDIWNSSTMKIMRWLQIELQRAVHLMHPYCCPLRWSYMFAWHHHRKSVWSLLLEEGEMWCQLYNEWQERFGDQNTLSVVSLLCFFIHVRLSIFRFYSTLSQVLIGLMRWSRGNLWKRKRNLLVWMEKAWETMMYFFFVTFFFRMNFFIQKRCRWKNHNQHQEMVRLLLHLLGSSWMLKIGYFCCLNIHVYSVFNSSFDEMKIVRGNITMKHVLSSLTS